VVEIPYDVSGAGASELTEEMARFLSRANCLAAIRDFTFEEHGDPPHASIVSKTGSSRPRISGRPFPPAAEGLLRIAWQTELAARFALGFDDPILKRVGAQTLPVNSYYAVFNCRRALGVVRGMRLDQHRAVAGQFAAEVHRCPKPLSVTLVGDPELVESCALSPPIVEPYPLRPIERSHPAPDYLWGALRMARRWQLELAREAWLSDRANRKKNGEKRKILPPGKKHELGLELRPTTLHDFLWELRRRANYESADEYSSEVGAADFVRFHDGLICLLDTAMLAAETEIAQLVGGGALKEVAAEWILGARRVGTWATEALTTRLSAINQATP
jgi:hypothetical protein